jgi:poly(3-hydroxybutyrate) depolymerase
VARRYTIHVPSGSLSSPVALVLVLHGGGGEGTDAATNPQNALSVFRQVADREGFLAVFPQGLPANDGEGPTGWVDCRGDNQNANTHDDVGFLFSLTQSLREQYGISSERVFVSGGSNGALMTFALVKHHPEMMRAIATAIGNLPAVPRAGSCADPEQAPMAALLLHGTSDAVMPYGGGCVADALTPSACRRGTVISAEDTVSRFREANGLDAVATTVVINPNSQDAGEARRHTYSGPHPVVWWQLMDAGHRLPSTQVELPTNSVSGMQNRDVEFAELAWEFFAQQLSPNPPAASEDAGPGDDGGNESGLEMNLNAGANLDVALPLFPARRLDVFRPTDTIDKAVVFLHGGGGNKSASAMALGIAAISQDELDATRTLWVFPQGLAVEPGAETWSNHVMTSGVDDRPFLARIAQHARVRWGVDEVWLAGHSNGGMMVQRMWCELGSTYDRYMSIAGPPSVSFDPESGTLACNGTRPYWAIVGDDDHVLQTNGNLLSPTWEIRPALVNQRPDAFVNPTLVNEARAHRQLRTNRICPGTPLSMPTDSATRKEWSDCGGASKLWLIRAATPYPVAGLGNHTLQNLQSDGGFLLRALMSEDAWPTSW